MILRSVTLQGCRCFRNRVEVGEFGDGVNLLVGDNECGKSTIVEAVARALFDRHGTSAAAVKALQPWGTNIAPEVGIEFEHGDRRYRLEKQFLRKQRSELSEWDGAGYQLLQQDDGADQFVRAMLLGEEAGGATKPVQWGLARTMWYIQREPADGLVSDAVADKLRGALGGTVVAAERGLLGARIADLYAVHFSPKTGMVRAGSPVQDALDAFNSCRAEAAELLEQYSAAEQHEAELGRIAGSLDDLQAQLDEAKREAEELTEEVQKVRELREALKQLQEQQARQQRERERLADALKRHAAASEALATANAELKQVEAQLDEARIKAETTHRMHLEAQEAEKQADQERKQARAALERCRELKRAMSLSAERTTLTERIEKLQAQIEHLADIERACDARAWPAKKDVSAARKLETDLRIKEAKLETVGVAVSVELLKEQSITFEGGSETLETVCGAGETREYRSGRDAIITLEGVARITARSQAEETQAIADEVQALTGTLVKLLMRFEAETPEALAELQAEHDRLLSDAEQVKREIAALAGDDVDLSGVKQHLAAVEAELKGLLSVIDLTEEQLAATDPGDEGALADLEKKAATAHDEAVKLRDRREKDKDAAIEQEADVRRLHTELSITAETSRTQMEATLKGAGCADLEALEALDRQAEAELARLIEQTVAREAELPDELSDPSLRLETVTQAIRSLDADILQQRERQAVLQERLRDARADDLYARKQACEERLAALQSALARVVREAVGIRLLERVYQTRREAASEPFGELEGKFNRILQHVTGRQRHVKLNADFSIAGFTDGTLDGELHGVDQLSSGAKEQMELIHRLALGEVYAENFERQMLVLDDVLVYTDQERHRRMLEVLKRAAEGLQIFILTSRPHFYRGITDPEHEFDIQHLAG